jgi:hypothetical protein
MIRFYRMISIVVAAVGLLAAGGCAGSKEQGAAVDNGGGAVSGGAFGGKNYQGGAFGTSAGYVVGANRDRILNLDAAAATEATQNAKMRPATTQEAREANTADLNDDGFVTLDEVTAMHDAGFTDGDILNRLRSTGQVFEMTPEQQGFLRSRGLSDNVVTKMQDLNRSTLIRGSPADGRVISSPIGQP